VCRARGNELYPNCPADFGMDVPQDPARCPTHAPTPAPTPEPPFFSLPPQGTGTSLLSSTIVDPLDTTSVTNDLGNVTVTADDVVPLPNKPSTGVVQLPNGNTVTVVADADGDTVLTRTPSGGVGARGSDNDDSIGPGETLTLLFARSRPAVIVELLLSDFEQGDEVKLQFDRDVAEDDDELSSSNATQQRRRDVSSGSVLLYAESSQLEEATINGYTRYQLIPQGETRFGLRSLVVRQLNDEPSAVKSETEGNADDNSEGMSSLTLGLIIGGAVLCCLIVLGVGVLIFRRSRQDSQPYAQSTDSTYVYDYEGTLPVAAVDVETPSGNQYDRVEGSLLPATTLDTAPAPFPYTLRNNTSGPPALPARRPPQPPSRKPANNSETYGKVPTEPVAPLYDTVADVQTHAISYDSTIAVGTQPSYDSVAPLQESNSPIMYDSSINVQPQVAYDSELPTILI